VVMAYITAKVEPATELAIRDKITKLERVKRVSVVYGDVDLIIEVETKDLIELRELTERIRGMKGVAKTITYLVREGS
jgi:DNA-binding Lrp family transcriptional regulator